MNIGPCITLRTFISLAEANGKRRVASTVEREGDFARLQFKTIDKVFSMKSDLIKSVSH